MSKFVYTSPLQVFSCFRRVCTRTLSQTTRLFKNEIQEDEGPVKFSQSPASKYRAKSSRTGIHHEPRLWYEPHVILTSLTVFLIYFTILREENDIDEELGRSLYSRIEGLEELHLRQSLVYNEKHGKDTTEIRQRLEEIENEQLSKKNDEN